MCQILNNEEDRCKRKSGFEVIYCKSEKELKEAFGIM